MKEKSKPHFLHIDFSRWIDEDLENEDPESGMPIDPSAFMNLAGNTTFGDQDFGGDFADSSSDEDGGDNKDELPKLIED